MDRHCHGHAGVDFATASAAEVRRTARDLAARGVTRVVASLPTLSEAETEAAVRRLAPLVTEGTLAGLHLEGPFLATDRCGAHDPVLLRSPADPAALAWLDGVLEAGRVHGAAGVEQTVLAMTYAPELPGAADLEALLRAQDVSADPGHTDADAAQMLAALDRLTAPTVTHLFNAMRGFHHRDPGPVPALLRAAARGSVRLEVIADGHHVDPSVVRDLFDRMPGALCVVSDASAATDLSVAGACPTLGSQVLSPAGPDGGAPRLPDGTLASGAVSLDAAWRNLLRWGVSPEAALAAVTTTPAASLPPHRRDSGWLEWTLDPGTSTPAPGPPAVVGPGR